MIDLTNSLVLERWLFDDPDGENLMAYIASAFDASYDNKRNGIAVVAGLVGDAQEWNRVEKEWRVALKKWNLPKFHLAELVYKVGDEQAPLCENYFARIIGNSALEPIGSAVSMDDFKDYKSRGYLIPEFKQPHYLALYNVLVSLWHQISSPDSRLPCSIVVDNDYNTADAVAIYSIWCQIYQVEERQLPFGANLGPIQKQCADLVAGAIRRSGMTKAILLGGDIPFSDKDRLLELSCPNLRMSIWSKNATARVMGALNNVKNRAR